MRRFEFCIRRILPVCCLVAALTALTWLWGCGDGRSARLRAIDAIMEDDSALALARLDSVDARELSADDYPYYCLLMTQAQVKNNIVVTDDSLISVAYEAYAHGYDRDLRKRANFYSAQVAYYAKDYRTAMHDILAAYEVSREANDPYWTAKSAEIIGDIYFNLFNYGKAEGYKREAAIKYKEAGKIRNHRYALSDLNATLMNQGKEDEAIRLIDSLHRVVKEEEPLDTALYEYIKMSLYSYYSKTGQAEELHELINEGLDMEKGDDAAMDLAVVISNALDKEGNKKDAELYLINANNIAPSENDRARVLYASFKQSLADSDFAKAAPLGDTLIYMQSNLMRDVINESVTSVQSDFYSAQADENGQRARRMFWGIVALSVFVVTVVVLLHIIHRLKMRVMYSRMETILESLRNTEDYARSAEQEKTLLSEELKQTNIVLSELKSLLNSKEESETSAEQDCIEVIPIEWWETLNMLCSDYLKGGSEKADARNNLIKEIEKITTPSQLSRLRESVDRNMDGIVTMLNMEFPDLKEQDVNVLAMIFAGMNSRVICLFAKITYENYYKKRSRLKERIEKSDAPHKELFLSKFGKNIQKD